MNGNEPLIRVENLKKEFVGVHALNGVSTEIQKGEVVFVVGPSGSGKSTFLRCLNRLEDPTGGHIYFNGVDLMDKNVNINLHRQKMGMVFQHFNLFPHMTVLKNMTIAPMKLQGVGKEEAESEAMKLLARVGLADRANAYPSQLSGGQKQRVAIARVLASDPKILLCDEATSALDPQTTKSILQLLKEINQKYGITIVVITHEMAVVQEICTHVAIIDQGNLAEHGTVEEIFLAPKSREAKRLIYQGYEKVAEMKGKRCVRIVFSENSSFEPVISNMVLAFKAPVNILYANTRDLDGVAKGEMVLQLPEDEELGRKMIAYLKSARLTVEELEGYVD